MQAAFFSYFGFTKDDAAALAITPTAFETFLDTQIEALFTGAGWGASISQATDEAIHSRITLNEVTVTSASANEASVRVAFYAAAISAEYLDSGLSDAVAELVSRKAIALSGEAVSGLADLQGPDSGLLAPSTNVRDLHLGLVDSHAHQGALWTWSSEHAPHRRVVSTRPTGCGMSRTERCPTMAVPGVPKRGHFLLVLSMLQTACWAKEPPNCDSIEAQRLSEFVSWCEGVCEVSYEAGFAQGIDCATDPVPYVNRVEEWISTHGGNPISDDPTDPCGFPFTGTGLCGSYTSSHSDKLAGAFDYGYYDGWRLVIQEPARFRPVFEIGRTNGSVAVVFARAEGRKCARSWRTAPNRCRTAARPLICSNAPVMPRRRRSSRGCSTSLRSPRR